ncbi:MAG: ankyrin repeat domain-containing protein [Gammaproteobacteria bacterium]
MFSVFFCRKKARLSPGVERTIVETQPEANPAPQGSPITKLAGFDSLGAHLSSFLPVKDALKSRLVSKQLFNWDKNDRDNHIWRERLKKDFFCHENFVKQLKNAKEVYIRICQIRKKSFNGLPSIEFGYIKHQDLKTAVGYPPIYVTQVDETVNIETRERYLSAAIIFGNSELVRYLTAKERGKLRVVPSERQFWDALSLGYENLARVLSGEIQVYHDNHGMVCIENGLKSGRLSLVKWLIEDYLSGLLVMPEAEDRRRLLNAAAYSGNLALFKWWLLEAPEMFRAKPDLETLKECAHSGNPNLIRWLIEDAPEHLKLNLEYTWSDWVHLNKYQNSWRGIYFWACCSGNLEVVKLLLKYTSTKIKLDDSSLYASALSGNISLLRWWTHEAPEKLRFNPLRVLDNAITSECPEMVKWVRDQLHVNPTQEMFDKAASRGNIALLHSLMTDSDLIPNSDTFFWAAFSGNLDLLLWLTAPERGAQQLHVDQQMIQDAISESGRWRDVDKTRQVISEIAKLLVKSKSADEYKSPIP